MGSLRKKADGVWELRVFAHGKATSRTFRGTKTDAGTELKLLEARAIKGEFVEPDPTADDPLLRDWLKQWLSRESPTWSPTSAATAETHIRLHINPALGGRRITTIRVRDVELFIAELRDKGLAAATQIRVVGVLQSALEQAERWELIAANPAAKAKKPTLRYEEPTTPTAADLVRSLTLAPTIHHRTLIMLGAATGGRRGQLVALRWSDFDLAAGTVTFHRAAVKVDGGVEVKEPKGGKPIPLMIDPLTVGFVREYRRHRLEQCMATGVGRFGDRSYVFARDPLGKECWYPDTASKAWAAVRDMRAETAKGEPPGPLLMPTLQGARLHDLRHAHGSILVAAGIDRKTVAERLGHAQLSTTDRYLHAVSGTQARAAATWAGVVADAAGDGWADLVASVGLDQIELDQLLGRTGP